MEHFEETALDAADYKPAKWPRYVEDLWFGHTDQQDCSSFFCTTTVRPAIRFTMEVEADDALVFWDILVMKRGPKLASKVQVQSPTPREKGSCL
jgi:hypothetical protein